MRVKDGSRLGSLRVAADQRGLVSRSGSALVSELAAQLGLERELSERLGYLFRRRPRHDPGRVLVDLATMLIDGGDCVSDLGALAEQPDLFGPVASHSTATPAVARARRAGAGRDAGGAAASRGSAPGSWGRGRQTVTLDFDAQLLECHTEKEGAGRTARAASASTRCTASSTDRGASRGAAAARERGREYRRRPHRRPGGGAGAVAGRSRRPRMRRSRCRSSRALMRPAARAPSPLRCAAQDPLLARLLRRRAGRCRPKAR